MLISFTAVLRPRRVTQFASFCLSGYRMPSRAMLILVRRIGAAVTMLSVARALLSLGTRVLFPRSWPGAALIRTVKLVALCLCLVVAFMGTSVATALGATAQEKTSAGDAALQRFDLEAALSAYREATQLAPDSYEALWKLSRALADEGTLTKDRAVQKRLYVEAEQLARTAVRLNPQDSKGHVYLAIAVGKLALYEGGKRKVELSNEIKVEADKAIELNPKEDLAYHVLAIWNREMVELNWMLKKFAELLYGRFPPASLSSALANLRRAVELAPRVVPHYVELGITLASAGQWVDAKAELEKALAMPRGWVTDEYYWELAKRELQQVKRHIENHTAS